MGSLTEGNGMTRIRGNQDLSMISGSIEKSLLAFAGPLLLSSLLQQTYNAADSFIVGRFLGDNALAAVSSSSSLIFLMVDFFNGLFAGAGVLVANRYGGKDREGLFRAVHTTMAFGLIVGILMTFLGNILAPVLLRVMETPDVVMVESLAYFRVYFSGSLAFVLYNCCTGILRSIGDSIYPLIYLTIASVLNIILDIVFIGAFRQGVASAALATIIAQGLSAALCLWRLCRRKTDYQVLLPKIRFYGDSCKKTLQYGIPSGIQNSMIALSNVIVQASVNTFDVKAIAGCGVWSKLEGFGVLPVLSLSMALSTFVGQNLGAGRYDRVRKGSRYGILWCGALSAVAGVVLLAAAPFLTALFKNDPDIIYFSALRARIVTPFFLLLGISNGIGGILRGAGRAKESMMVYITAWCLMRIVLISIGVRIWPDIRMVFMVYPVTWTLSTVAFLWLYRRLERQLSVEPEEGACG